ncbi:ATP-dependent Lhr-like helicase [Rhodobacter viridis]|uniref:ATP-dependent Lhr-like helicase n=1 Tax=Rhodobacter viridis TaxID=1054202 RepID=A0A318TZY5_9RHOB|nr:DEAD/DEAH box helicase [Rhodobacter viridis]PYF09431.1 ATP-dependent Lhr-like helicase [Rhodobacter viridis]
MSGAFEKLARPVQKWIRAQGWRELRDIQSRAICAICDGQGDLILAAATAGGKTEAAFLPLISQVLEEPAAEPGFDLLYIGPLKALITDQARRLEDICAESGLPVVPWHGDVAASVKARALKAPRGILLITPESLEALFVRRGLEIPRLFGATRSVVLDELHSILDSERGVQVRSLLTRLEQATGHSLRRIGLSATLGDMGLARRYLRPDAPETVALIEASGGEAELRLQLRGYLSGEDNESGPSATDAIAAHLFDHLRGSDNLVFAGARQSVEIYADRLRARCEEARLPQEFYPHHASLSREHRDFVEKRLKDRTQPTTAICTSTLELGIDIGDVTCVAQIGAPFSVAALRQRLGRSGRRAGQPAILRQYSVETRLTPQSGLVDRLRLGLVRAVAMIELLLEGWCEPPRADQLHLSTLVHQVLSVIAGQGGASASQLYRLLCREGPFRQVSPLLFTDVLRAIGRAEAGLIEQAANGLLLLGLRGEKLVEHYGFYAVFPTPEEYRLISAGRDLGTIPLDNILAPGMMLIFSGRRWSVREIDTDAKVIMVEPAKGGVPPRFGGEPGLIHDRVIEKMRDIYAGNQTPVYMDRTAVDLLAEARCHYHAAGFAQSAIVNIGPGNWFLATGCGTVKTATLALALQGVGYQVDRHDGFLELASGTDAQPLEKTLAQWAEGAEVDLFAASPNLIFEPYHPYLGDGLLRADACSSRLEAGVLPGICARLLEGCATSHAKAAPARATSREIPPLPGAEYRFLALDVETANGDCASICQIGLACVRHDGLIDSWSSYIDPEVPFSPFNTRLHGIGPVEVCGAPRFLDVIAVLEPLLNRHVIFQHSGFDPRAIAGAFALAGLRAPSWLWQDSVKIARCASPEFRGDGGHGLAHLKDRLGLDFAHHDAAEDARAAAMVVLLAEQRMGRNFEEILGIQL